MEAPVMFSNRFWRNASGVLREGQSSTQPKATFAERFIRCLTSLQMWPPPSVSRTWQPNLSQNITTTFVSKITSRQVYFLLYLVFFFVACFYIREQRLGLEFPCHFGRIPPEPVSTDWWSLNGWHFQFGWTIPLKDTLSVVPQITCLLNIKAWRCVNPPVATVFSAGSLFLDGRLALLRIKTTNIYIYILKMRAKRMRAEYSCAESSLWRSKTPKQPPAPTFGECWTRKPFRLLWHRCRVPTPKRNRRKPQHLLPSVFIIAAALRSRPRNFEGRAASSFVLAQQTTRDNPGRSFGAA